MQIPTLSKTLPEKHVDKPIYGSEKGQSEIKALEEEIGILKSEIAQLKNDAKIKENKLETYRVKESEDAKLFEDITGKALGEANLIQIVKDLEKKKNLKKSLET